MIGISGPLDRDLRLSGWPGVTAGLFLFCRCLVFLSAIVRELKVFFCLIGYRSRARCRSISVSPCTVGCFKPTIPSFFSPWKIIRFYEVENAP